MSTPTPERSIQTHRQELSAAVDVLPDNLVLLVLDFIHFITRRHHDRYLSDLHNLKSDRGSSASVSQCIGTWVGSDIEECLDEVRRMRG